MPGNQQIYGIYHRDGPQYQNNYYYNFNNNYAPANYKEQRTEDHPDHFYQEPKIQDQDDL